jgi:hypothetical protein
MRVRPAGAGEKQLTTEEAKDTKPTGRWVEGRFDHVGAANERGVLRLGHNAPQKTGRVGPFDFAQGRLTLRMTTAILCAGTQMFVFGEGKGGL